MNALAFFVLDTFGRMSLLLILIAGIVLVDYKMKYFIRGHDMIYGINAYVVFQII